MTRHISLAAVLILIDFERTLGLNPPQDVKLAASELQWKPPEDDDSLLYSLQYKRGPMEAVVQQLRVEETLQNNLTEFIHDFAWTAQYPCTECPRTCSLCSEWESEDEWQNVLNHTRTKLRSFNITDDFYGAVFRVHTEKGHHMSEWVYSSQVRCVNVNFCAPVINLSVKPGMVLVNMSHMDQSLEEEYGVNIKFNISLWKVDNGVYSKVESVITNNKDECFEDLKSGQNYCFQVEYLFYDRPYGKASEQRCVVIPETPEVMRMRVLLYSTLITLFASVLCGVCILILTKHRKRLKQWLQPLQLEIPDHYGEFLSGWFTPVQMSPSRSSQSLRSYDMVTIIENTCEEQNSQEEEQERPES